MRPIFGGSTVDRECLIANKLFLFTGISRIGNRIWERLVVSERRAVKPKYIGSCLLILLLEEESVRHIDTPVIGA